MQNWQTDANCNSLASHVLVFYVVGINSSLKKSMGFFATRTARAEEIYPLFSEAVRPLEQTHHLKVVASTSNNPPPPSHPTTPTAVCTSYMVIQGKFPTKPSTFMSDRNIYFSSDPPHLIKTARNNLFCSGNGNGKTMLFGTMELTFSRNMRDSCTRMTKRCRLVSVGVFVTVKEITLGTGIILKLLQAQPGERISSNVDGCQHQKLPTITHWA